MIDALGRWREFYMLPGTASATMVGLLFVAVTVGSGEFSVVHCSGILAVCLIVLAPL